MFYVILPRQFANCKRWLEPGPAAAGGCDLFTPYFARPDASRWMAAFRSLVKYSARALSAFRQLAVSYGLRARSIDALVRGPVRFRPESASLTVTGYVSWSVPAFLVYLGFVGFFAEPLFLVAVVVMLTLGYLNERQFFDEDDRKH
jgi:hypothetical protein